MNGVSKLLPWRDKKAKAASSSGKSDISKDVYRIFHCEDKKRSDRDHDKKIKALQQRLEDHNVSNIKESQIDYALRSPSAKHNPDKAFELLLLLDDAVLGKMRKYDSTTKMLGAENREFVTCYIDSLLFAMFARMDSFEGILAGDGPDPTTRTLATVLRLWVNMLRAGQLITTDITKHLQDALADCGWEAARKLQQQDVSEAFSFITDKLALPLITLKMDVYHTGKDDSADHRLVKERMLEVAIPKPSEDGSSLRLEDCLEEYFNNRVDVRRLLARRNTLQSARPTLYEIEKASAQVETISLGISRKQSLFSRRNLDGSDSTTGTVDDIKVHPGRPLGDTLRNEVLMPAWQFFNLVPWSTTRHTAPDAITGHHSVLTDAQIAAQFAKKETVLGICLKRYFMTPEGKPVRLNTKIDIPLQIQLPHFISDGTEDDGFGSSFTKFKLVLQSVICHRGTSVNAGHYISLVRPSPGENKSAGEQTSTNNERREPKWLLSDDLANERVKYVDVHKALTEEMPYLVFYRVEPIDEGAPPTYDEATRSTSGTNSVVDPNFMSDESNATPIQSRKSSTASLTDSKSLILQPVLTAPPTTNAADVSVPRPYSLDLSTLAAHNANPPRKSTDSGNKRSSVAFTDSVGHPSAPITPGDELVGKDGYISGKETSRAKSDDGKTDDPKDADKDRRLGRRWLSVRSRSRPAARPSSLPGENRRPSGVGGLVKNLRGAISRDKLPVDHAANDVPVVGEVANGANAEAESDSKANTGSNGTAAVVPANITTKTAEKSGHLSRGKSIKKGKAREHSRIRGDDISKTHGDGGTAAVLDRQCVLM